MQEFLPFDIEELEKWQGQLLLTTHKNDKNLSVKGHEYFTLDPSNGWQKAYFSGRDELLLGSETTFSWAVTKNSEKASDKEEKIPLPLDFGASESIPIMNPDWGNLSSQLSLSFQHIILLSGFNFGRACA